MRRALAALAAVLGCAQALADAPAVGQGPALQFLSEHAVEGMPAGNLSGLALCGGELWTVSDRDDDRLYGLRPDETPGSVWQARAETFSAPGLPDSGLSWGARARTWLYGLVRGGAMDFEGVSCDGKGNRYLVSEAYAGVLRVPEAGAAQWLELPPTLLRQARASGLLMVNNAYYEGLAIDADGKRLWLAAERQRRGLGPRAEHTGDDRGDGHQQLDADRTLPYELLDGFGGEEAGTDERRGDEQRGRDRVDSSEGSGQIARRDQQTAEPGPAHLAGAPQVAEQAAPLALGPGRRDRGRCRAHRFVR